MEDTGPDEGIELVVRVINALAVDEEVEIEVPPDGIHVVVDVVEAAGNYFEAFGEWFYQPLSRFELVLDQRES